MCATCVSHKLAMRALGGDLVRRRRQMELWDEHRKAQYCDRRVYWAVRAEAKLSPLVICIICDGMDQAEFAYPRSDSMKSKALEGFQRPRLHVNAVICHGREVLVGVSRADMRKNTDVTLELVAVALT